MVAEMGFDNVSVQQADIFDHHFDPGSFDHIFVCFVLEHLDDPVGALVIMKDYLAINHLLLIRMQRMDQKLIDLQTRLMDVEGNQELLTGTGGFIYDK